MARHKYSGGQVGLAEGAALAVTLAAGATFTLWSDATGGSDWTSLCTDGGGVTTLVPAYDAHGRLPTIFGPVTQGTSEVLRLWIDDGQGGPRVPWNSDDRTEVLAASAGSIDTSGLITPAERTKLAGLSSAQVVSADGVAFTFHKRTAAQGTPPNTLGSDGDVAVVASS